MIGGASLLVKHNRMTGILKPNILQRNDTYPFFQAPRNKLYECQCGRDNNWTCRKDNRQNYNHTSFTSERLNGMRKLNLDWNQGVLKQVALWNFSKCQPGNRFNTAITNEAKMTKKDILISWQGTLLNNAAWVSEWVSFVFKFHILGKTHQEQHKIREKKRKLVFLCSLELDFCFWKPKKDEAKTDILNTKVLILWDHLETGPHHKLGSKQNEVDSAFRLSLTNVKWKQNWHKPTTLIFNLGKNS